MPNQLDYRHILPRQQAMSGTTTMKVAPTVTDLALGHSSAGNGSDVRRVYYGCVFSERSWLIPLIDHFLVFVFRPSD
jgi:hypothetical protein